MFAGETFEQDVEYQRLKNLLIGQCFSVTFVLLYCCCTFYSTHNSNVTVYSLYNVFKCPLFLPIDFFRGPVVSQVRLAGLEHVIMVTATEGKILIRNYRFIFIALVRITVSFPRNCLLFIVQILGWSDTWLKCKIWMFVCGWILNRVTDSCCILIWFWFFRNTKLINMYNFCKCYLATGFIFHVHFWTLILWPKNKMRQAIELFSFRLIIKWIIVVAFDMMLCRCLRNLSLICWHNYYLQLHVLYTCI